MSARLNLVGAKFGRLTVTAPAPNVGRYTAWSCACECGESALVRTSNLRNGYTTSCGCIHSEGLAARNTSHGMTGSPEYVAWCNMKARCHNPHSDKYEYYGGRGIKVADEWRNSFEAFLAHIGERPEGRYSVGRIDHDKNYEPGNVRWEPMGDNIRDANFRRHGSAQGVRA